MKKVKKRKRRKTNRKSVKKRKRRGGNTLRDSTPSRATVKAAVAALDMQDVEETVDVFMAGIFLDGWVEARRVLRQAGLFVLVDEIEKRHLSERGQRDEKILKLSRDGETVSAIAKKTGVSSGTVYRVLKKEKGIVPALQGRMPE